MTIKFKKLTTKAVLPVKKTDGAIGYDLTLSHDVPISKVRNAIPLGFAMELPEGIEAKIEPRSGFSANGILGFDPISGVQNYYNADVLVGKIDPDYRGDVHVIIRKNNYDCFIIPAGTRIAQMTFYRTAAVEGFDVVDELSDTDRDTGGFGHTGATDNAGTAGTAEETTNEVTETTEELKKRCVAHYDLWVARDKESGLWAHTTKPTKHSKIWGNDDDKCFNLDSELFPEVQWEDEEPTLLYIDLIK